MPQGRPTDYSEELADRICELVATHTCGLEKLCEMYDLPDRSTINLWKFKNKTFSDKYLDAKRSQAELLAEECLEISNEKHVVYDENGNAKIDPGHVALQRLQVNTRHWHASRLAPKVYGNKTEENDTSNQQSVLEKILNGEIEVKKK